MSRQNTTSIIPAANPLSINLDSALIYFLETEALIGGTTTRGTVVEEFPSTGRGAIVEESPLTIGFLMTVFVLGVFLVDTFKLVVFLSILFFCFFKSNLSSL